LTHCGKHQTAPCPVGSNRGKYLLGAAAVSALGWIVGSVSGGEMLGSWGRSRLADGGKIGGSIADAVSFWISMIYID